MRKSFTIIIAVIIIILICLYIINKQTYSLTTIKMKSSVDTVDFSSIDKTKNSQIRELILYKNSETDTLDILYINSHYYIPIKIDTVNLPFTVFDTGSSFSLFNINTVNDKYTNWNFVNKNIRGDIVPTKMTNIDTIRIGTTEYIPRKQTFNTNEHSSINLLGGDVIKHFVWKIDNLHNKIYFSRNADAFIHINCRIIPFSINYLNIPIIKCIVDKKEYNVLVDTGYSGFMHIIDSLSLSTQTTTPQDSFIFTNLIENYNEPILSDNHKIGTNCITLSDIRIGNLYLKNETVAHNEFASNLLGWNFFQRFEYVILDYINKKIYLGPNSELKSFNYISDLRLYINTIGFNSTLQSPYIIKTISDSLYKTGLSIGDTIIELNGEIPTPNNLLKAIYSDEFVNITVKNKLRLKKRALSRRHYIPEPDTVISYGKCYDMPLYRKKDVIRPSNGGGIIKYYEFN